MASIKRYLVSQRFGPILSDITFDAKDGGTVRLSQLNGHGHHIDFSFSRVALTAAHPDPKRWAEALTRSAIAQAHRNFIQYSRVFDDSCEALDFQIRPWIGDVQLAAHSGADR